MSAPASSDLVVYTCITAGYDDLPPVAQPEAGVRYVCLTDRPLADARGWEVRQLPQGGDPVLANRHAKMHPHLLFPEHARSVYVDGNITVKAGVRALADEALKEHDFAAYAHPVRDCIYAEAVECARIGHEWVWAFGRQARRYRAEGFPRDAGLYECNILFRNHHAPAVVALMEAWWREFTQGVPRDQLSLPYLLWQTKTPIRSLGKSHIRTHNDHFAMRVTHNPSVWRRNLRGMCNQALLPWVWVSA